MKRTYNSKTKEFITMQSLPESTNHFYMAGKYEANDADLMKYSDDLFNSNMELKHCHIFKGYKQRFDYINEFWGTKKGSYVYKSHDYNIMSFFKLFTNNALFNEMDKNTIRKEEATWIKKTFKGGLYYSVKGEYESYGYDFKNFYGSVLASKTLKIPTKEGKECFIDCIPDIDKIEFGFYKVTISCDHPDFKKIFSTCKNDVYTHYDLKYAMRLMEFYDINIMLNTEDDMNCYLYDKNDLITGKELFGKWHETIVELKELYPKNILIKGLSSTLWGHICQSNCITRTEEDAEHLNWGTSDEVDYYLKEANTNLDGSRFYKLHDMNKPYKHNIRIKSFLHALGRNKIANIVLQDIDSVIRICTDGICFNKPFENEIPNFIPEPKTTGLKQFPIRHEKLK
jgi:hypothetical protein